MCRHCPGKCVCILTHFASIRSSDNLSIVPIKGIEMNTLCKNSLVIVAALLETAALAQEGPSSYPVSIPNGPPSGLGWHRRQEMEREFWENWKARYRLEEELARGEYRSLRGAYTRQRIAARSERIEQARQKNLVRQLNRQQNAEDDAKSLQDAMGEGTFQWPYALRANWARIRVQELGSLMNRRGRLPSQARRNMEAIARELIVAIQADPSTGSMSERREAIKVLKSIAYIAGDPVSIELAQSSTVDKEPTWSRKKPAVPK